MEDDPSELPRKGWVKFGTKVPRDAVYAARYQDQYAWVMRENISDLTSFTVVVLDETRIRPEERSLFPSGILLSP